ncbi:MAG: HAMP domain-containing sensor histidine kinase [Bryobacteraceae bacterium]
MGKLWQERAIVALLLAACLVLAFLQYRWTGELSRAEGERLMASAGSRLQQFTRAFDTELRRSVLDFVPPGEDVQNRGVTRANEERLQGALARLDRPIFVRIAAAVPDRSGRLTYFEADQSSGKFAPAAWPDQAAWQRLRERLEDVAQRGSPPGNMIDPASALMEIPVFSEERELEWMLFEIDTEYAARTWLPELARAYLDSDGDQLFRASVEWSGQTGRMVFGDSKAPAVAQAAFFPVRFGRGGRSGREAQGRWIAKVTHEAGFVPAAVEAARRRNFGLALVLLALIAAAGFALLRNTRQARRLAAAQYQFFAGISHELRTPLTVIQGSAHNLSSGVVKDDVQRQSYLRAIVKQSAQLNEMVDQVLAYGSASNASAGTGSAPLDVAVSEAIEAAAVELEQSGRSVDVDMPPDLPELRGDPLTLRRVLSNLILNAIRHGGGEVRVSARRSGGVVEITVSDSGDGIPPDELKQIFEPFFRGEQARNGRSRGTGLGLSLVKESVESLGGNVTVESFPGKGTAITLRWPVASV